MEKWKTKGRQSVKTESVLPPTRRSSGGTCLPTMEKKKDRKWSFGSLLRRISSGQNNEVSSNDEDITYIPGHMLSKKNTKKTSKMRSKLGKIPNQISDSPISPRSEKSVADDTPESTRSFEIGTECSHDFIVTSNNDSANLRSSDGSLDAAIRASKINRTKARAQAKRDRLCGNSSSDDDSHKSNQSLMKFRSDENMDYIQRIDSASRKTRGARTERYIKRMYRDDCGSSSDSKIIKPVALPRTIDPIASRFSSNSIEKLPSVSFRVQNDRILRTELDSRYLRDMNENETHEREKRDWQDNRKSAAINEIYGSPRSSRESVEFARQKLVPPEPPPRSSTSRIFRNVYGTPAMSDSARDSREITNCISRSPFLWQNPDMWRVPEKPKGINEKAENFDKSENRREISTGIQDRGFYPKNDNCNSLDRGRRSFNDNSAIRRLGGEQENYDPRAYFENAGPPNNYARSTYSLPKGLQLFSRQRLSHSGEIDGRRVSESPHFSRSRKDDEIPILRKSQDCQIPVMSLVSKSLENDEAERKRSSKNLEEALFELETIYNSLRLSDDDLLERAEQRSMEEYRDKAAKSAAEHSLKSLSDASSNEKEECSSSQRENESRMRDDMAYRRMNPKERPSSVNGQVSLSNISYLATSPNLSVRGNDYVDYRGGGKRGTPDLTRDDLLFRSISHANNTLRVIEPQPPFGIPLGPVTAATESDYLHVKPTPTKIGQTRSLYIPKSEPDVVGDDLAFRNLRKDPTRDSSMAFNNKNTNIFLKTDSSQESRLPTKNTFVFGANKKRAVRSMSADLYGIVGKDIEKSNSDWYNDYIKSTQKLRFLPDASGIDEEHFNDDINAGIATKLKSDESAGNSCRGGDSNLDINGNRPKSALQRKIQVFVPQGTSYDEAFAKQLSESREEIEKKSDNCIKFVDSESEDSNEKIVKKSIYSITSVDTESEDSSPDQRAKGSTDTEEKIEKKTENIMRFNDIESEDFSPDQRAKDSTEKIERKIDDSIKFNDTISEDSMSDSAVEREISEYLRLCNLYLEKKFPDGGKTDEHNSQSEFDELEKLLFDYEHENAVATSTEREDDRSSARSVDQSGQSRSSDNNVESSPTRTTGKFDDDASSTSELGNSSGSNAGSSLNESVYDKFNELLRAVDDVPFVTPKNIFIKYPIDKRNIDDSREISRETKIDRKNDPTIDGNSRNFVDEKSTLEGMKKETHAANSETIDSKTSHLYDEKFATNSDDSFNCGNTRIRKGGRRESRSNGDDEKSSLREGEKLYEENEINEDANYAFKDNNIMHPFRKLCHVTNSITAYHVVACSLFLTLLITIIVAQ